MIPVIPVIPVISVIHMIPVIPVIPVTTTTPCEETPGVREPEICGGCRWFSSVEGRCMNPRKRLDSGRQPLVEQDYTCKHWGVVVRAKADGL